MKSIIFYVFVIGTTFIGNDGDNDSINDVVYKKISYLRLSICRYHTFKMNKSTKSKS